MEKKGMEIKKPPQKHKFMGIDRELIDWFPEIDYEKCNDCLECVKFCAHGVYDIENGKVVVVNPKNCVVFCKACMKLCPMDAMVFPSKKEILAQVKKIKAEMKQMNEMKIT